MPPLATLTNFQGSSNDSNIFPSIWLHVGALSWFNVTRGFGVGDAIEAQWKGRWWPGVIDKLYKHKLEIHWENGAYNAIPRAQVRARAVETRADRRRRF